MLNIYSISSIIASIFCFLLAFLVYLKNRSNIINKSFVTITFLAGIWTLSPFLSSIANDDITAILLNRIIYFAAVFVPSTFLSFILNFIGKEKTKREETILLYSYMISLIFFSINFTPILIRGIKRFAPNFYIVPGQAYHLFVLFFGFVCLYAFVKLLYAYKNTKGYKREQFKYIFIAFIMAYASGLMHFMSSYFGGCAEPFPHDLLLIIFVAIIAYAILHHKLMGIEIVVKKTAVYSILTALLTGVFLSFILLGEFFFRGLVGYSSLWVTILAALVVALFFQPLRDKTQIIVDVLFFRGKYNYRDTLKKISQTLASIIDLDQLLSLVTKNIINTLKIDKVSVFIFEEENDCFELKKASKK